MRSFDPRKVGGLECRAWETYYRRKLGRVPDELAAHARGRRAVLRANQVWAPFPDNDPDAARALLVRSYPAPLAAVHR